MKRTAMPRSSSLFLLELIFSILFFSIASAICVQVFVQAHLLSLQSRVLNFAVTACSDAVEIGSGAETASAAAEKLGNAYPKAAVTDVTEETCVLQLGFDTNLETCDANAKDASYLLTVTYTEEAAASLLHCEAVLCKVSDASEVYRLDTVHFTGGGEIDE